MAKKVLPKKIKKAIREYLKILKREGLSIQKVYLFGSFAKSKAKKWSDLDLCIISPKFKNPNEALDYLWERRIVNKNVHIEPFGYPPKDFVDEDPLVWEIKKTGKEIKV
jgi:predicted nucleotidyltransferase